MSQSTSTAIGEEVVSKTHMPYRLDGGAGSRVAIGLIVLATDQTIEQEWKMLLDLDGVAFFSSRIQNSTTIAPETLRAMESRLTAATSLILPQVELDVVAYGCTSASMVIGEEAVTKQIAKARPGVKVTTPVTAARAAFSALGIKSIALLTPYTEDINHRMRDYFEKQGTAVPVMGSFNNGNDTEVVRICHESIRDAALELGSEDSVEAVFISCTSLRGTAIIESMEAELNKPVTTSCHAMAWHALRLGGYQDPVPNFGSLFQLRV